MSKDEKDEFKVFPDKEFEGAWRVESIDPIRDQVCIAIFSGPDCERIAHEYVAFMDGSHPALGKSTAPPLVSPVSSGPDVVHLPQADGGELLVRWKEFLWSFCKRTGNIKGKPRPAVEQATKGKA
jgi:hypothetical protein